MQIGFLQDTSRIVIQMPVVATYSARAQYDYFLFFLKNCKFGTEYADNTHVSFLCDFIATALYLIFAVKCEAYRTI